MLILTITLILTAIAAFVAREKAIAGSAIGEMLMIGLGVAFVVQIVIVPFYIISGYEMEILNRVCGTNYTQAEVFFASQLIVSLCNP